MTNEKIQYNVCATCGANSGRAGLLINGDCQNCHDTKDSGAICIHSNLQRTDAELAKTFALIK